MKTIWLTTVVWVLAAAACCGQDIQQLQQNTAAALEQQRAAAKKRRAAALRQQASLAAGRALFGADERWTGKKQSEVSGTLLGKTPPDFRIGDWGCTAVQFKTLSKVSNAECLVMPQVKNAEPSLLRGLDMSKVTDGVQFILQHPVVIQETYSYNAVSGARKTVLVLEVNESRLAEATAKIRAAAEAERAKIRAALEKRRLAEKAEQEAIEAARQRVEDAKRRIWTSGQHKVEAEFITVIGNKVTLKRLDNVKQITVPMDALSAEDQAFIKQRKWLSAAASPKESPLGSIAKTPPIPARSRSNAKIPIDAVSFQEHHYFLYLDRRKWKDADNRCKALGGYLVRVDSDEERAFLTEKFLGKYAGTAQPRDPWIGMRQRTFVPNGEWGSPKRDLPRHYICEWE